MCIFVMIRRLEELSDKIWKPDSQFEFQINSDSFIIICISYLIFAIIFFFYTKILFMFI